MNENLENVLSMSGAGLLMAAHFEVGQTDLATVAASEGLTYC